MSSDIKVPEGYKASHIGLIPIDWEIKQLNVLGDFKNGINKEKSEFGHGYPFVNLMDVFGIPKISVAEYSLVNTTENERRDFNLKKGDILFVRSSVKPEGVGLTTLICEDMSNITYSGFLIRFRPHAGHLDFGFRAHCFFEEGFRQRLLNKSTISANTNINQVALKSLSIVCPPIAEQKKITLILDIIEDNIGKIKLLIKQKELRREWLTQQLITGKKRIMGLNNKPWRLKKLDECLLYTPRQIIKPQTSFFALGIRSHGKGIFHKNDFEPDELAMDVLYEVKENDLVVNITFAWEHAIAIAGKDDEGGLVSHRFPTYMFNRENALPEFFKYLILQKSFKYKLDLISPGGAGRNRVMSKKDFLKIEVLIPEVDEQKAIANILDCASKEIELLKVKADKLKEQKKGMMQLLLTGKKRLKVN